MIYDHGNMVSFQGLKRGMSTGEIPMSSDGCGEGLYEMDKEQQTFFQKVSDDYGDFIKARASKEELRRRIEPRMGGRVLDIGNGGIRDFFSPMTQQYIGLDFSLSMLRKGNQGGEKVCGDALALPFKKEIFDTLFYRSMLHHLARKKVNETEVRVKQALVEGYHLLEEKGNIMVVEPCISQGLEKIERVCYFLIKIFCRIIHQPEVLLFSAKRLRKMLKDSGYGQISEESIPPPGRKSMAFGFSGHRPATAEGSIRSASGASGSGGGKKA